jgi:hypothetical protein
VTEANEIPSSLASSRADQCVTPRCSGGRERLDHDLKVVDYLLGSPGLLDLPLGAWGEHRRKNTGVGCRSCFRSDLHVRHPTDNFVARADASVHGTQRRWARSCYQSEMAEPLECLPANPTTRVVELFRIGPAVDASASQLQSSWLLMAIEYMRWADMVLYRRAE